MRRSIHFIYRSLSYSAIQMPLITAVYLLVCGWVVFGSIDLVYYDELLHAVAAQRMLLGDVELGGVYRGVTHEVLGQEFGIHRVPMMILYYVGPLKSYLLVGWFGVFGSTVFTLRLFTVMCGLMVLCLVIYVTRKYFGDLAGSFAGWLLAADPSFVLSRVFDWGPVGVQDLLKMGLLVVALRILFDRASWLWYGVFGLVSGVMVWEKLNGAWVMLAMWLLVFLRLGNILKVTFSERENSKFQTLQIQNKNQVPIKNNTRTSNFRKTFANNFYEMTLRISKSNVSALGFGGLVGLVPMLLLWWKRPWFWSESMRSFEAFEVYALANQQNYLVWNLLKNYVATPSAQLMTHFEVLSGRAIPLHILKDEFAVVTPAFVVLLSGVLWGLVMIKRGWIEDRQSRVLGVVYVVISGVLVAQFLTGHANAIHHALVIYPLVQVIVAVVLARLWVVRRMAVAVILGLVMVGNWWVLKDFGYAVQDSERVKVYWRSGRIEALARGLEEGFEGRRVVALDWGVSLPLAYVSEGRVAVEDLAPFYEAKCQVVAKMASEGAVFVLYGVEDQVFSSYYSECGFILENYADVIRI